MSHPIPTFTDVDTAPDPPVGDVERVVRLLSQRYGMYVPAWRRSVVASKLDRLRKSTGADPGLALLERGEGDAWDEMCTSLMVPETYFFRHARHFRILAEELTSRARSGKACCVLCAGCSTGEEVWSVAAVLAALPPPDSGRHRVVGWDVSDSRLRRARIGRYGAWSFRRGCLGYERWFRRDADGWSVRDELRGLVDFATVNLARPPFPEGRFDAVLFRNVAIYFDATTVRKAYEGLIQVLGEGGLILVGPHDPVTLPNDGWALSVSTDGARIIRRRIDETPSSLTKPRSTRMRDTGVRARPDLAPRAVRPQYPDPVEPTRASAANRLRSAQSAPRAFLHLRPRPAAAAAPPAARAGQPGVGCTTFLAQIESLANQGKYLMALEILNARNGAATLDEQRWEAILLLNLGREEEAVSVLRRCVFLDPDDAVCRRWLEAAFRACGSDCRADCEGRAAALMVAS